MTFLAVLKLIPVVIYFTAFCVWAKWAADIVRRLLLASRIAAIRNCDLLAVKVDGLPLLFRIVIDAISALTCGYFAFVAVCLLWSVLLA